uniref:Uncharacterized protein n=1 Tax=Tanacetum cinerariifolium TaxID=118510 RepID=A0A699GSH2_TANCI|nr:hypothetical protein [Tanacetum cinerariifolium]
MQKKADSKTSPKKKPVQASKGKRIKFITKVPKSGKKKLLAQGLETLSEIALSEAEQMKIATKRSRTQFHVSHANDSDTATDDNDDDDKNDYDQEDDVEDDDDDEQTESDNDGNDFEEKLDEDKTNKEEEVDELYKFSVSSGFITNMLNPNSDTGIDSILNLNTELISLVDVPVTTNVEMPPSYVTTIPLPPIPLIQPQQQTLVPTPIIVPSTSLQNLPTFGSLFKFNDKVKTLEDNFLEFKQTNLFAEAVSSILDIVDTFLANKMNEAVKTAVQLQSDRLRDEAQAKNEDFINKLDENIKKIIKEQVKVQVKEQVSKILPRIKKLVNEHLEAEVLTRSSNEAKTSHALAANLSELEPKNILINKIESNKSIHRLVQQKTLYKALIDAYENDKVILDTYGDTITIKRRQDDEDDDEEPSAGSNQGSKRRRAGKEPESTNEPKENTSKSTGKSNERSKSHQKSTCKFAQAEEPIHTANNLEEPTPREFNTNFSAFVMNRLKVDTLTLELLAGPTFERLKGSCKSLVELEYFLKEVYKATTDKLDWNSLEGQQYLHDMRKPLPLISNSQGHRVIPFDHFINNEFAYLRGGALSRTYANSVTKTKAAYYRHIKWIKDLIVEWHDYKTLDWITVRRNDDKLCTFKEGDYKRLRLQEIKDMLLLLVQGKLKNLTIEERLALNVSLRMFTRSIVIQRQNQDEVSVTDILKERKQGRVGDMIQVIDKKLKNKRIMRSLEIFVGGRLYEEDFQQLERTI